MRATTTLATAVGRRLREVRDDHGWVQEEVARAARACGLDWSRATVATIETGRRDLSASELVLLPTILLFVAVEAGTAPLPTYELQDLIPDGEDIQLAPDQPKPFPPDLVRATLSGGFAARVMQGKRRSAKVAAGFIDQRATVFTPEVRGVAGPGDAEDRAALRLGVPLASVLNAAMNLWGHSLTRERDRRVAERAGLSAESRRAVRGRVTRQLIDELRQYLETPLTSNAADDWQVRGERRRRRAEAPAREEE